MGRPQSARDSGGSRLEAPTIRVPAPRAPRSGGPTVKPRLGPPGSPREVDEDRLRRMDEDVERAQISMDHPGADEPADTVEHLLQEFARVVEADILKSRGGTFLGPEVLHREAVLDPARGRRHADAALPGLTHHLVLVGGPPPHRVLLHGPPAPMGGPVEAVR